MRVYYAVDTSESAQIIAAATILLWMNLLYYLRPFKATSAVVRMLYVDINNELKAFIFILTFLLFGFSQSLFMLSENDATQPFGSPDTAFLSAFISMMGQTNWNAFTNTRYEGLGQLIGVLLVTACAIIMLNILIAILCKFTLLHHLVYCSAPQLLIYLLCVYSHFLREYLPQCRVWYPPGDVSRHGGPVQVQ
jgi:hypothetical protein